jgi:hypothetical protein
MKRPQKVKPSISFKGISPAETELRRWCVEQALRWPSLPPYPAQGIPGVPGIYQQQTGVDVLGRAELIRKWITTSSGQ